VLALCGAACAQAGVSNKPDRATISTIDYVVRLESRLDRAHVRACMQGGSFRELVPTRFESRELLATPTVSGVASTVVLDREGCARYVLDLDHAAATSAGLRRFGRAVLLPPDLWLWAPPGTSSEARLRVAIELPNGTKASLPWRYEHGRPALVDASVLRWRSHALFGEFTLERFVAASCEIELALVDGLHDASLGGIRRWLASAVETVALVYAGEFPVPRIHVIVVPTGAHGGSVQFGILARGGGPSVLLFVDSDVDDADLPGEWVAVHELVHVTMPFISLEDAWLSEGIASYYAEVLRTRAGFRSPRDGWHELVTAFERGRADGTGESLRIQTRTMHETGSYQRVYWAGAALAFMFDVNLRSRSRGRLDLDHAMRHLTRCCRTRARMSSARELLGEIDRFAGGRLFGDLASRHLDESSFPDVEVVLQRLGVRRTSQGVVLDDTTPDATIRRAIMGDEPSDPVDSTAHGNR